MKNLIYLRIKTLFIAVFCIALLSFNSINAQTPVLGFTLSGNVKSAFEGSPITQAVVVLNAGITKSDSMSNFKISNLANGEYQVSVIANGFEKFDTSIIINNADIEFIDFYLSPTCLTYSKEIAAKALKNKSAKFVVIGGASPVIYATDKDFLLNFDVRYDLTDLEYKDNMECAIENNVEISKHLDKKFGLLWRTAVRKDIVGASIILKEN